MNNELYDKYKMCVQNGYINPILIKAIITNELRLPIIYDGLKEYIRKAKIDVKCNQIDGWIKIRIFEKYPHLKKKTTTKTKMDTKKDNNDDDISINIIKNILDVVPNVLTHYQKDIDYYKLMCSTAIDAIDSIISKSEGKKLDDKTEDKLRKVKIKFNCEGYIDYDSAIKLVDSVITNFRKLYINLDEANNLDTYVNKTYNIEKNANSSKQKKLTNNKKVFN